MRAFRLAIACFALAAATAACSGDKGPSPTAADADTSDGPPEVTDASAETAADATRREGTGGAEGVTGRRDEGETGDVPSMDFEPGIRLRNVTDDAGDLADVTAGAHGGWGTLDIYSGGVVLRDLDGDGHVDVFVARTNDTHDEREGGTVLLRGRGDGTFEEITEQAGVGGTGPTFGATAADLDGNGLVDLFVAVDGAGDRLYMQQAPMQFEEVGAEAGIRGGDRRSRSVTTLDADLDGWLDLYVTAWDDSGPNGHHGGQDSWKAPNALYINQGDGTFVERTEEAGVGCFGRSTLGTVAADFDGDRDPDLYVVNDFFDDCLYDNQGDGTFEEISQQAGVGDHAINGMGVDVADFDRSGTLDVLVTDTLRDDPSPGNALYRNQGQWAFEIASLPLGLDGGGSVGRSPPAVYWGVGWHDLDLDGLLDVHVVQQETGPDRVYTRDALGERFEPVDEDRFRGRYDGRGSAYADIGRDGRIDVVVMTRGGAPQLHRNVGGAGHHWLRVRPVGPEGNPAAVGATIRVEACGREHRRIVTSGSGYLSSSAPHLPIGLGDCEAVDRVDVHFPNGTTRTRTDVDVDGELVVPRTPEATARR